MANQTPRWTEIEHLPEWDEEFYHIYTAKKFGKWVMIKTLRPEYADDPRYQAMIEQEFDVRYSLAHPNIIMINDFEDIPGIGRCIVTDDVYGDSLAKLISERRVTRKHVEQLRHQLVNALEYIQGQHIVHPQLKPENIIFTENIGNYVEIEIGYGADIEKAVEIMRRICVEHELTLNTEANAVTASGYTQNGVTLKTIIWTQNLNDSFRACSDIRIALVREFGKSGIEIPYQTVTISNYEPEKPD